MSSPRSAATRGTTLAILGIVLAASSSFVLGRLAWTNGDPSGFVDAGKDYTVPGHLPSGLSATRTVGFDGQFYYRLGLDPFTTQRTQYGLTLDQPARRQQRILYPLIAWAVSGGSSKVLLWALIAINVLAALFAALGGTVLARSSRRSLWAGLFFAGVPGLLIALGFDTAECVSLALLVWTLALTRRARFGWATVSLTMGALARETSLLIAIGLLVALLLQRRKNSSYEIGGAKVPYSLPMVPLLVYTTWATFLWARWGALPFTSSEGGTDLGTPVLGLLRSLSVWHSRGSHFFTTQVIFLMALVAVMALGIWSMKHTAAPLHERAAFMLGIVLVLLYQQPVWFHYVSFLRTSGEMFVLALVLALDTDRPLLPAAVVWVPTWTYLFFQSRVAG